MYLDKESWKDIQKYFEDTYIKLHETGDKLWRVYKVDKNYVYIMSLNNEKEVIDLDNGYNLDFVLPRKATFLCENTLYNLSRTPARQWHKGIHTENTSIYYLAATGWKPTSFSPKVVEAYCFKNTYFTLEQLNKDIFPTTGVPLTNRFSVHKNGSLYLDTIQIGKLKFETKQGMVSKLFKTEIESQLNWNKSYTIEYYE